MMIMIIEIKCNNVKYVIVNVYNPPDVEIDKDVYNDLFKFKNCVLLGDFKFSMPRVVSGRVTTLTREAISWKS